jgi:hypothetical protein
MQYDRGQAGQRMDHGIRKNKQETKRLYFVAEMSKTG